MALQIWLPLNGDLHNQGLRNITITKDVEDTYVNNGKIGKALATGQISMSAEDMKYIFRNNTFSICFWVYINADTGDTTKRAMFFGNNSPRRYSLFQYSTCNDLHWSWANDTTNNVSGVYAGAFPSYTWTHLAVTYDSSSLKIYLNGELKRTMTVTYSPISLDYTTLLFSNCANNGRYLNDYRIYDHALSAKEVEEISKGLILHYKLDNNGQGQYNLLKDTNKGNYRWIAPSGNGTGTVTSILIDGINCVRYEMTVKSTNWCVFAFRPTNNTEVMDILHEINSYTLSFDIFPSQPINNAIPRYVDGNAQNNLINWPSFSAPANAWYHYEGTAISSGATQSNQSFYINYLFDIGTYDFKNLKIEIGTKATGYNTHSEESFLSNIIYDSSGYERNGKYIDNTCSFDTNSSRYNISTKFNGTTSGIIIQNQKIAPILSDICTICFWIKGQGDNGGRSIYFSSYSGSPFWCLEKSAGNKFRYDWNGNPDQYSIDNILDDVWIYICLVRESSTSAKFYINGEYKQTFTSSTTSLTNLVDTWRIGRDVRANDGTPYSGLMSDFRIYCTALTDKQIKELYDTSATADKNGNMYGRELIE